MPARPKLDPTRVLDAVDAGRLEWRKHCLQRMVERGISQKAMLNAIRLGNVIEDNPEDMPFPTALFLGWNEGDPIHVVVSFDEENDRVYVVTVYEPDMFTFAPDHRTRRRP
jgi:hypothetical protein